MKEDDLISRIVKDPSDLPDARAFFGFLGRSARAGYWRLYVSLEFNEYLEFSEMDVVHSEPLSREQSPIGGSMVWLKRTADVRKVTTFSQRTQAEFLQGPIATGYLGTAQPNLTAIDNLVAIIGLLPLAQRMANQFRTIVTCTFVENCKFTETCTTFDTCKIQGL